MLFKSIVIPNEATSDVIRREQMIWLAKRRRPVEKNDTVTVLLRDHTKLTGFADTFDWKECGLLEIVAYRVENMNRP